MESEQSSRTHDPRVVEILERARTLDADALVRLARAYDARTERTGSDRARVLSIAIGRSDRASEVRDLEAAVTRSLATIGPGAARQALLRLGLLDSAELAVRDAVLAVALEDRLGPEVASDLSRPWDSM
jgi:hypothetical protein